MKNIVWVHERAIIILVGECFIEEYKNEDKVSLLVKNSYSYIGYVYKKNIICNPDVLYHALKWTDAKGTPQESKKYSGEKAIKFKRFIKRNNLPPHGTNLAKWFNTN